MTVILFDQREPGAPAEIWGDYLLDRQDVEILESGRVQDGERPPNCSAVAVTSGSLALERATGLEDKSISTD